jgi:hypothetical protein
MLRFVITSARFEKSAVHEPVELRCSSSLRPLLE